MSSNVADPLAPSRTPARPGPGRCRSASLRALELTVGRRVDGLLAGDYRSAFAGVGSELWQVRPYEPGDDVRRIEWNVTARTGETHVRVELAERVLVTWLVLDASASMAFGTGERRKADVAEGVAVAVGHRPRGGATGSARSPSGREQRSNGRARAGGSCSTRCSCCASSRAAPASSATRSSSPTGTRGSERWSSSSRTSAARPTGARRCCGSRGGTAVLAVEIRDPREQELADIGELRLVDPETGRQLRVDTGDRRLRERFAAAATQERRTLVSSLASIGVRHVALSTEGDWLHPLAAFLRRGNRAR